MRISLLGVLAICFFTNPLHAQAAKVDPSAELFTPGKVPLFRITLDAENLKKLLKDPRAYVRCTVEIGDLKFPDVGIHLKGAAGSYQNWDQKPALTLNADKFKDGQLIKGLDKLHLNNSVQDGSYLNEILYAEIAAAFGIPCARAGHALVELNGRKVGFYVVKEGFDNRFIKRYFPKAIGGNLYDGGFLQDVDADLKLGSGPGNDRKDLKALAAACRIGDAKKRYEAVSKLVDVDLFVADCAMQILTDDWDGYMRNRNNYRVYFPPKDGKAVFIPHGKDQLWQQTNSSLWPGAGAMVSRAILDYPEGKKATLAKLKELSEKHFDVEKLNKRIDEWAKPAREAMKSTGDKNLPGWFDGQVNGLKDRLKQRAAYIKKELPRMK
jgi:spore coat protein CotH